MQEPKDCDAVYGAPIQGFLYSSVEDLLFRIHGLECENAHLRARIPTERCILAHTCAESIDKEWLGLLGVDADERMAQVLVQMRSNNTWVICQAVILTSGQYVENGYELYCSKNPQGLRLKVFHDFSCTPDRMVSLLRDEQYGSILIVISGLEPTDNKLLKTHFGSDLVV